MSRSTLQPPKVKEGVEALLGLLEKEVETKNKKNIIDQTTAIFLQIDFVKIPKVSRRIVRIPLQHSLVTDSSDVCLFVADLIRGRNVGHDVTVNHYNQLLKKRGVFDVHQLDIIPSRRVRVEFDQFEAKRKLCDMYDFFLIDEKISSYLLPKLGKPFHRNRKWPVPVRMKRKNLKAEIASKLKKTSVALDGSGPTKTLQVGRADMSSDQITDNILAVTEYISSYFPSGWKNIRSLHLKGPKSASLPLFISCISPNEVPTPVLKRTKPKKRPITGELTTLGKRVAVYPGGGVKVLEPESDETESEEEDQEDEKTSA